MSHDIHTIADDFRFCEAWRAISEADRAALAPAVRAGCIDRYRELTRYVDLSVERARRTAQRLSDSSQDAQLFESVELVDGASVAPEPVRWWWEGFLSRGKLHVLAGAPGTGKTMIALSLAATVSSGRHWPDGTRCDAGRVIIWSAEDDIADALVPRLTAMGANMNNVGFIGDKLTSEGSEPFDPAHDMPAVMRTIAVGGTVSLLIIDPIVSAVAGDSHKNAEVRRGLQPLVHAGQVLGAAVLGVSHFTKGTAGRDVVERVTGSLAFGALARVVLAAAKCNDHDGSGERIFVRAKSNIGPNGGGFAFDVVPGSIADRPDIAVHVLKWGGPIGGDAREVQRRTTSRFSTRGERTLSVRKASQPEAQLAALYAALALHPNPGGTIKRFD